LGKKARIGNQLFSLAAPKILQAAAASAAGVTDTRPHRFSFEFKVQGFALPGARGASPT
jgi:hypothetical protein